MRLILFSIIIFQLIAIAQGAVWVGEDAGDNWDQPSNWSSGVVPGAGEKVQINKAWAQPCILDSDAGVTIGALAVGDNGGPVELIIKGGGFLTVGSWAAAGYKRSSTLRVEEGGTLVCETFLTVGMHDEVDAALNLTMTGGMITIAQSFYHGKNFDGSPAVSVETHLDGGTLEANGIVLNTGVLDITGGVLVINGNVTGAIHNYAEDGLITAYGGSGYVIAEFNDGKTIVTASSDPPPPPPVPAFPPGDFDDDWDVDLNDLTLFSGRWLRPDGVDYFDLNDDGSINSGDFTEISDYWLHEMKNVVFIVIDDLNTTLGCYGHPVVQTPHMDGLAQKGMRFNNACCQFAVCNPSRSSFMTGLRPDTTGIFDNKVAYIENLADRVSLPQLFRNNGYFTKNLGKVFNGGSGGYDPLAWDENSSPGGTSLGRTGEQRNMTDGVYSWCYWQMANGDDEDQADGNLAREAVEFIQEPHDKPFFLALGFHKPHDPFRAPASYFDLYPLEVCDPPVVPAAWEPLGCLNITCGSQDVFGQFDDQDRREFLRAYYACTTFVDTQIGKVIQALQNEQLMDDTIIVLFGDHGYHLGEHHHWNKVTVFERSHRCPFIVVAPGYDAPAGSVCEEIVEFVDIYPTLAEMCKLKDVPVDLEGVSFTPLLNDPTTPWKESGYIQVRRGDIFGRAVHTHRWRYVEWDGGVQGRELYDHYSDPLEYNNLAGDPAYADEIVYLQDLLRNGHNRFR